MFNPTIQNYFNSSGEAAAITRAKQLDSYINSLYATKTEASEQNKETEFGSKPFNEVLKTSFDEQTNERSIFKLDAPPNIPFGSLSVGAKINNGQSSKTEILKIIDETCDKYNVDAKLVKALVQHIKFTHGHGAIHHIFQ